MGLAFFVVALSLFPFGVGASPDILARIGAGVIWVVALLAVLLTLDRLWQADYEDGSLELILLAPVPLELLVVVKCLAHWLTSGLLLVVASPLLALLMNLPIEGLWALPLALLLGTPDPHPDRLDRCRTPGRQPPRQRADGAACPAALHPRADFRRRGGRGPDPRAGRPGAAADPGGDAAPGPGADPFATAAALRLALE